MVDAGKSGKGFCENVPYVELSVYVKQESAEEIIEKKNGQTDKIK